MHPFDDPLVVAGQGTLGLELLAEVPDLAQVIVPVGGGGLTAGVAIAVKHRCPRVRAVGVQAAACAPFAAALAGRSLPDAAMPAPTIVDSIAVKRPGGLTLRMLRRWLDEMVVVDDDAIADAMDFRVERSKLVVEGAGAAGLAALLSGKVPAPARGTTVVVLSGANVDAGLLASVAGRSETAGGRRLRLFARIPDRPRGLAALLAQVAGTGANVISVEHVRDGVDLHVRETGVELTVETRGREHAQQLLCSLAGSELSGSRPPTRGDG